MHPNLRGATSLQFTHPDTVASTDVLFLAMAHGRAAQAIDRYAGLADRVIDCSADFRLRDPALHARWYGADHPATGWMGRFTYGLPERYRAALAEARYASGVGCNATATILALAPLAIFGRLHSPIIGQAAVIAVNHFVRKSLRLRIPGCRHLIRLFYICHRACLPATRYCELKGWPV